MDSRVKLFLERAENEITLAKAAFVISKGQAKEILNIPEDMTFYSSVISHAYYCIFYTAKAILLSKDTETGPPEEHKKTLEEFEKRLVITGILDVELLNIYKSIVVKADELLNIFSIEKKKRGEFTYQKLPQANVEPAEESINNAQNFFTNIYNILEK